MKKSFYFICSTLCFMCLGINISKAQQIDSKILEVLGNRAQEILQSDPQRISLLTDLLNNRIKIIEVVSSEEEKYPKLSSVGILNKYNTDLKRDVVFDPNNFNALKYNLNFFSTKKEIYRVDDTNYLIVIEPQISR